MNAAGLEELQKTLQITRAAADHAVLQAESSTRVAAPHTPRISVVTDGEKLAVRKPDEVKVPVSALFRTEKVLVVRRMTDVRGR